MKKIMVLFLAMMTCFSLTANGGGDKNESKAVSVKNDFTVTYPIASEGDMTLTCWSFLPGVVTKYISNYDETEVFQAVMERTGVTVEFTHPAGGQQMEQFNLLIAAGDLPDIIGQNPWGNAYYKGGSGAGVEDGVFLDLTDYIPTYAPDFYNLLLSDEKLMRDVTTEEGRIPAFFTYKNAAPPFKRFSIRKDVIAETGYDYPELISEYEPIFVELKKMDMIPISLASSGYEPLFLGLFDLVIDFYEPEQGKVAFAQIQDEFKDYLALMNSWYEKDYISKDFMMMEEEDNLTLFDNRELGFVMRPVDLVFTHADMNGFEFMPLPYPRLTKGQLLHHEQTTVSQYANADTCISADSNKKELAMQFLNYFYTSEGAELANYGIEGLSWNWVGDKRVFTDHMLNNEDGIDRNAGQNMMKLHAWARKADPDILCNPNVVFNQKALDYRMMYSDDSTIDDSLWLPPFKLNSEDNAERASLMTEINTYVNEMTLRFLTGATPLSEFDSYVASVKAMGIDRAVELTQKAYDVYLTKKVK